MRFLKNVPLEVKIEDDGRHIISEPVFNMYGEGETFEEAAQDLAISLDEYFDIIKGHAGDNEASRQHFDSLKCWMAAPRPLSAPRVRRRLWRQLWPGEKEAT